MRRLILATCLALTLCGCGTMSALSGGPGTVAEQTKLDEQLGLSITLAYTAAAKAAGLAIEGAAASGHPLSNATLDKIDSARRKAYALVTATRQAYEAGNSTSYLSAATQARAAVADFLAAVKG